MEKEWFAGTPRLWIRMPVPIPFCPGCQHGTAIKMFCEVVDELGIEGDTVLIVGVGCSTMASMLVNVDSVMVAHGRPCDVASAMKRVIGEKKTVTTWQGDGDTMAIGTEPTLHAASRGEKITTVMINNGNYGTTGGQLAPTTAMGQVTTTCPEGRGRLQGFPIRTAELMANLDGVAYSARGAFTNLRNYNNTKKYMKTALQKQSIGYSFLEILSTCPANWHLSPQDSVKRIEEEIIPRFPLGEFKNVDAIE